MSSGEADQVNAVAQEGQVDATQTFMQRNSFAETYLNTLFPKRNIKKVLFVIPPDGDAKIFSFSTAKRGRYWNYPPYGIGVLATILRRENIEVDILNLNNEILKQATELKSEADFNFDQILENAIKETVGKFNPDLIGMSCMFSQTHQSTIKTASFLKRFASKTPISLGGVHPTNGLANEKVSTHLLGDFKDVDFVFSYESELSFINFIKVVNKEVPVNQLGQVYFNHKGRISLLNDNLDLTTLDPYFRERMLPPASDLDLIPAWDLMKPHELSKYGKIGSFFCFKEKETNFATVISNRGCRARCTFCSVRNFNGLGVRTRSVQSVIDELKVLQEVYGVGHIMWLDDDFLFNKERSLELFNEMVRQNIKITWDCTNGVIASSCTEEVIEAASKSGCVGLTVGMESGNNKILREINKPGNDQTFLRAAEVLRRYENIVSRVFLMIGFPGETYNMILDTIRVASEMNLDWYNITMLQPLPNTPIFETMLKAGLIDDIDFTEIRYNSGAYGKQRTDVEKNKKKVNDLLALDFKDAFNHVDKNSVPPKEHLDDVWAYMNYHLNFNKLFKEHRPTKLQQHLAYVENISDLVAPENAFAMYFAGLLQQRVYGKVNPQYIEKLAHRLDDSPYWLQRFKDFNLSLEHLKTGNFPQL